MVQVGLPFFIASCLIARGGRFFALAYALKRWGEPIGVFIERRFALIGLGLIVLLAVLYLAVKLGGASLLAC